MINVADRRRERNRTSRSGTKAAFGFVLRGGFVVVEANRSIGRRSAPSSSPSSSSRRCNVKSLKERTSKRIPSTNDSNGSKSLGYLLVSPSSFSFRNRLRIFRLIFLLKRLVVGRGSRAPVRHSQNPRTIRTYDRRRAKRRGEEKCTRDPFLSNEKEGIPLSLSLSALPRHSDNGP